MKKLTNIIRYIAIVFCCFIVLVILFPTQRSHSLKKAKADSLNAYPTVCLGGWQNPSNAAGQPDISPGDNGFSAGNSAVLNQGEGAQIFCGSFQSDDESQAPSSVTLHFSWNVVFAEQASTSVSTDTDSATWSGVLDATSTAASSSAAASSTDTSSSSTSPTDVTNQDNSAVSTSTDETQNQSVGSTTTAAPQNATDSLQTVAPLNNDPSSSPDTSLDGNSQDSSDSSQIIPSPAVAPAPDQSDSNQTSTSFLENITRDPMAFLIPKTFADSDNSAGGFLDVSYSLDGTNWQDLEQVREDNWQNFSVTIPVSSWDDINKLQIQLGPSLSADAPTIYLDSMWLEIDYSQSLSGILQDGANAALNAMSDLSDAVDSAANALTNLLPSGTTPIQPQNSSDRNASSIASAPLPPVHRHTFQINGGTIAADVSSSPQWLPANDIKSYAAQLAAQGGARPTVTPVDQNTFRISGTCSLYYYTVLLFANKTDYEINPAAAVYNVAAPCMSGSFDETLSDADFPPNLAPGTYYLMVANQGKTGPWEPYPAFYPVVIGNASSS